MIRGRHQAVIVRDAEGQPLFLQGVISDITERREMVWRPHESLNRSRTLSDDELLAAAARYVRADGFISRTEVSTDLLPLIWQICLPPEETATEAEMLSLPPDLSAPASVRAIP